MPDDWPQLDGLFYESPDRRRQRSRRVAFLAVLASTLLLALVGRLLHDKFAPAVRARLDQLAAQRAVLALASPNAAFGLHLKSVPVVQPLFDTHAERPATVIERVADQWRSAFFVSLSINAFSGESAEPQQTRTVYLGPLTNAAGTQRIVCLRLIDWCDEDDGSFPEFAVDVRDRIEWWRRDRPVGSLQTQGRFLPVSRPLHLEPPRRDPRDPQRLLLDGVAGSKPFAFELLLDADDRAQCFDLLASHASMQP